MLLVRSGCAALLLVWLGGAALAEGQARAVVLMDLGRPGDAAALLLSAARSAGEREGARVGAELTFQTAQALWAAGQRSSALERYMDLLTHPDKAAAPRRAAAARRLNQQLAFPVSRTERLATRQDQVQPWTRLDPPLREGLAHRLGLHWLRRGDPARAARAFNRARGRAGARYLAAVLELRRGKLAAAVTGLIRAQELAGRQGQPGTAELARLALARLALERGQVGRARELYRTIPFGAPTFFRAQQELAWLQLRAGAYGDALARSAVLRAPAMRIYHRPDRELVEAAALLGLCHTAQARRRSRRALARLSADEKRLRSFLRPRSDRRLYYVEAMASAARESGTSARDPLVAILLADPAFRRAFTVVRQLQRERRLLLRPAAEALHRELAKVLDRRLVLAQQRAGETVKGILTRALNELDELRARARELRFDVDDRAIREMVRRRERKHHPRGTGDGRAGRQIAPGRQQTWPFVGEYWSDEIGHFVLPAPSRCGRSAAPRGGR